MPPPPLEAIPTRLSPPPPSPPPPNPPNPPKALGDNTDAEDPYMEAAEGEARLYPIGYRTGAGGTNELRRLSAAAKNVTGPSSSPSPPSYMPPPPVEACASTEVSTMSAGGAPMPTKRPIRDIAASSPRKTVAKSAFAFVVVAATPPPAEAEGVGILLPRPGVVVVVDGRNGVPQPREGVPGTPSW